MRIIESINFKLCHGLPLRAMLFLPDLQKNRVKLEF
jgi:hypothetical protein